MGLFIRNVLLWTFGRGTWQYDIMCGLILAFIFLTPPAFLQGHRSADPTPALAQENDAAMPITTGTPPSTEKSVTHER